MTSANTGLSPEWDRWFDEAFIDLITHDDELIRHEFDALIGASWRSSPPPRPAPPAVPSEIESTEGRSEQRAMPNTDTPSGEARPPPE